MKQETLTQERLKELLSYDPDTGVFTWIVDRGGRIKAGSSAGYKNNIGYCRISVNNRLYLSHRLAWFYVYGEWPKQQLDHINGQKDDNRIENLREASSEENHQNRIKNKNNTSGYLGVVFNKTAKKWNASIRVRGRLINLGYFDTPEMADKAYRLYKAQIHTFNPIVRET